MNFLLAIRNLARNRWRSGLTIGGIAVATAMLIWTQAMNDAFLVEMAASVTAVELGDAQIHSARYVDEQNMFNGFASEAVDLEALRALPAIDGAAPRVSVYGLVGNELRSRIGRIIGVDPQAEASVSRIARGVNSGSWLAPTAAPPDQPRDAVLGEILAEKLGAALGDELVVFLQAADGSLGNDLLRVVGFTRTGNSMLDRAGIYVHIEDVQYLAALEGKWHEVAMSFARRAKVDKTMAELHGLVDSAEGSDLVLRHWEEIVPDLADMLEMSNRSIWVLYVVLFILAGLGILNTQRMSALERQREFGVLLAIGVTPGRMLRLVLIETLVLAGIGTLVGVVLGLAVTSYHVVYGLNMGAFASTGDGSFSYLGVDFASRLFFRLRPASAALPCLMLLAVGLLSGLWPALKSARLDAVRAIAGRT